MSGGLPPQPVPVPPARDDFDGADLRLCWISVRSRPAHAWSLKDRPGWLTLHAQDGSLDDASVSFVGRRQQHHACRVRALVDAAEGRGGLAVRLDEQHHYEVEAGGGEVGVRARVGALDRWRSAGPVPDGPLVLRVETQPSGPSPDHPRQEPDVVRLGYETPTGRFVVLDELDGRYLSTQVAGGFTGRVIGMYATAGTVRFDWFAYEQDGDEL
jgi:beta-xylosidase